MVKDCTECGNNDRCLQMIKEGTVVMCGGTLCRPKPIKTIPQNNNKEVDKNE